MIRLFFILAACSSLSAQTSVSTVGEDFHINGKPTYEGRTWNGHRVEGLLMNSRMVQATYDDLNLETAQRWAYPDTGKWDTERNVSEFIAAMLEWKAHGLLAVTVNFQGGSPEGYSKTQPWINSAFEPNGSLSPAFTARMKRVLDAADANGMAVILGYFYFGQDQRLRDEAAVIRATDEATRWLLEGGWGNVLVEVNNETDVKATTTRSSSQVAFMNSSSVSAKPSVMAVVCLSAPAMAAEPSRRKMWSAVPTFFCCMAMVSKIPPASPPWCSRPVPCPATNQCPSSLMRMITKTSTNRRTTSPPPSPSMSPGAGLTIAEKVRLSERATNPHL